MQRAGMVPLRQKRRLPKRQLLDASRAGARRAGSTRLERGGPHPGEPPIPSPIRQAQAHYGFQVPGRGRTLVELQGLRYTTTAPGRRDILRIPSVLPLIFRSSLLSRDACFLLWLSSVPACCILSNSSSR